MKKYGNDYRQNGKQFEYTGKWHSTETELKDLKRYAWIYTGLMAAALLAYIAGLMVNNAGSRVFFVLLPFVTMVFPVSYGIMGGVSLFLFCRQQERGKASQVVIPKEHEGHRTRAQYEKGICRPVRCSIAVTGLSLFSCVADLILILMKPQDLVLTRELLFEAASAITLVLGSVTAVQSWQIKAKFTIFE